MVEEINIWVQKIVVIIIICTIIEMILPESKNKKYIKTVMGIYVIFTIIAPVISKISNKTLDLNKFLKFEYEKNNAIKTTKMNETAETSETVAILDTNTLIEKVYIEKMKNDIEEKVLLLGYKTLKIEIGIETDNESNYGMITDISLKVEPNIKKNKGQNENNIITINKIIIDNIEEQEKETRITEKERNDIKNYLSETYSLDEGRIEVK